MLRAMNSCYSHRIEDQNTLPLEIEQALRNDYAQDSDKARRQRLALAHMATEAQLEQRIPSWTSQQVWSAQTVQDIHQDLFARLPEPDRLVPSTPGMDTPSHTLAPGARRLAQPRGQRGQARRAQRD